MTLEQGVDEALAWLAEPGDSGPVTQRPARQAPTPAATATSAPVVTYAVSGFGSLSPRELEVAALVARGMTNRQIANELIITEGTAANHVKHILARLTLDSRVQIAAWAVERRLHVSPAASAVGARVSF